MIMLLTVEVFTTNLIRAIRGKLELGTTLFFLLQYLYLSTYLSFYLPISLSIFLSFFLSFFLYTYLSFSQ